MRGIDLESIDKLKYENSDTSEHTTRVVKYVIEIGKRLNLKKSDLDELILSALLHDLGKLTTTKERKGKITAYGHDLQGEILARQFLHQVTDDEAFINNVCALVKYHMQPLFYDKNCHILKKKK